MKNLILLVVLGLLGLSACHDPADEIFKTDPNFTDGVIDTVVLQDSLQYENTK